MTVSRYQLGPALGGDPPYCIVYDDLSPAYPIAVHGPNIVIAEERARDLVARLNDRGQPVYVAIFEPKVEAEIIPIGKGKVRR